MTAVRRTPKPSLGESLRWAGWFCLASAGVLVAIGLRYLRVMPPALGILPLFYPALALVGHAATLAFALFPLCGLLAATLRRRRPAALAAALLFTALGAVLFVDSVVFGLYRFHLNGMIWNLLTGGAAGAILPITARTWLHFALVVLGVFAAEILIAAAAWLWVGRAKRRHGGTVAAAVLALILAGHGLYAWADAVGYAALTRQARYLPGYKPLTAKRLLRRLGIEPGAGAQPMLEAPLPGGGLLHYPLQPLEFGGEPAGLNLLLIVIDGWRFDMLTPEATPNVWNLAQRSAIFENHLSSGNATRFGIFGLFYGLHGTYWHAALAEQRPPVLLSALEQHGYDFAVFSSAPVTSPEFDRTVFAGVRDQVPPRSGESGLRSRSDRIISERFVEQLERRDGARPFFGFLFYDAPHGYDYPADAPAPFQPAWETVDHLALNDDFDPTPYRNRFLNSIHFVDRLVGRVLEQLAARDLLERTVILVTGDHGQEFNESGRNYWGHNGNFTRFQVGVPLVLYWPGREPRRCTHPTSHVDIAPTLLRDLLGSTTPAQLLSNGRHLLDTSPRPFRIANNWTETAVIQDDRIEVFRETGDTDTFDLNYREVVSAAPARREVWIAALRALSRFYAGATPPPAGTSTAGSPARADEQQRSR